MHCRSPGLIRTLVSVGTEKVSLRLRQVQRQVRRAIHIEVIQAAGHGQHGNATLHRRSYCKAPVWLGLFYPGLEVGIKQQIGKIMPALVSLLYLVQELSADDAAALPNARDFAKVDVPIPFL